MPAPDHAMSSLTTDEVIPHAWFHFLQASYGRFIDSEDGPWDEDLDELRGYQGESLFCLSIW